MIRLSQNWAYCFPCRCGKPFDLREKRAGGGKECGGFFPEVGTPERGKQWMNYE